MVATIVTEEHVETLWNPKVFRRLGIHLLTQQKQSSRDECSECTDDEEDEWISVRIEKIRIVTDPRTGRCKPWVGPGYGQFYDMKKATIRSGTDCQGLPGSS